MKKTKLMLCTLLVLLSTFFALSATAADDIVFTFENEASLAGWSTSYLRYNFKPGYLNGYAIEKSANLSDIQFVSPTLNITAEDYPYVILEMSFTLDASWCHSGGVFFLLPGAKWDQQHYVSTERYEGTSSGGFKKFVVDMTKNELWTGAVQQIRIDPFECPGSISLKSITLTDTLPIEEDETEDKKETTETVTPDTPKKETGVFLKPNTYNSNFTDVPASEWYASEVAGAYELGFVNGKTDTLFDPEGGMTVAEAITLAARTNNAYGSADYDFTPAEGDEWYTPYVNYAVDNGIIKADTYSDYDAPITRGQMAQIFASTLPAAEYAAINSVTAIPDVAQSSAYFTAVYKLYNAGIVMGGDAYGTYSPDSGITRCEAAAIINRVANKDKRLHKSLLSDDAPVDRSAFTMSSEAKYLIDRRTFMHKHIDNIPGNWDLVQTLSVPSKSGRSGKTIADNSETEEAYFVTKFFAVSDGVLDLEVGIRLYGQNGAYVALTDENGTPSAYVLLDHGKYTVLKADGSYTDTGAVYRTSQVYFDLRVNLDQKTFDLGIDGAYIGTYPLASANAISQLRLGTTKEGWITIAPDFITLTHNYLVLERFVNAPSNILPYTVTAIEENGHVGLKAIYTNNAEGNAVSLDAAANGKAGITSKFEKASGNVVFETYVLLPDDVNGAEIALTAGDTTVFNLVSKDGSFIAPNGETVKYVTKNLWTIVRFEADTATGKALVKINGKAVGTYDFANISDYIDGYRIAYTPSTDAVMYADSVSAFIKLPYPDDYVPEPQIPESDYLIGLNICSLWREGIHYGWEEISAYPEITPVLGYYDEGSPEVSDWEIKMMTEHGINYQIFCWYPSGNETKPIFRTQMNEALIDGYFNARYSDKMDFAIMWENSSVNQMKFEDFKNYTVPYWIEYFFKDDRYLKIDNKPLLTVWLVDSKFGDCSTKEAFDYLREECRKAGFDGCYVLLYSTDHTTYNQTWLDNNGMDGLIGYHWGTGGANVKTQAEGLTAYSAVDYTIPTISVGFDYVGWGSSKQRNGLLDPKDYPTLTEIVKKALAEREKRGTSPFDNMVNISTWNEYGEGTYVMPTERYGFGYLDAVRKAFTKENTATHNDLTLTDSQRQRINYLFDQNRQLLRPQMLEKAETVEEDPYKDAVVVKTIRFDDDDENGVWISYAGTAQEVKNGAMVVVPTNNDPAVFRRHNFAGVSTAETNAVRIRAKVTGDQNGSMQLFFRTDDGKDFTATKCANATIVKNEWADYYFDFRSNKEWIGSIVNLRIDPAPYQCPQAEIEYVEFLKLPELVEDVPFTVDIIGAELTLPKEPEVTDNGIMVAVYPEDGFFSRMMCTYSWDKNTKTLTVMNKKHTVSLVIGTTKMIVDGKEQTLPAATSTFDGLPVVPIDKLATALGYYPVMHEDGNGLSIMLESASDYDIIKTRKKYQYEFNLTGDVEDWTSQNCSAVYTVDGALHGDSNGNDPAVTSPNLSLKASDYPTITVRMKWDRQNVDKRDNISIYFKGERTGLSETRKVAIDIPASSNGEYQEFTFEMSEHLQWYGTITGIRVDPFNALGSFDIDYIRFNRVPGAEEAEKAQAEREANLDDTIANGDASMEAWVAATQDAGNATVSIVRSLNGDPCYDLKAAGGKVWTYFVQRVKFTPGASYHIEFDARMTGLNNGDLTEGLTTDIYVNLQYNGADHPKMAGKLTMSSTDEWQHYSLDMTVDSACNNSNDRFTIFTNPLNNCGVNYQLDNLTMTRID